MCVSISRRHGREISRVVRRVHTARRQHKQARPPPPPRTQMDDHTAPEAPTPFPRSLSLSRYMAVDLRDPADSPHFPPARVPSTGTVVFPPSLTCAHIPAVDALHMHVSGRPSSLITSLHDASCARPRGTLVPDQPTGLYGSGERMDVQRVRPIPSPISPVARPVSRLRARSTDQSAPGPSWRGVRRFRPFLADLGKDETNPASDPYQNLRLWDRMG